MRPLLQSLILVGSCVWSAVRAQTTDSLPQGDSRIGGFAVDKISEQRLSGATVEILNFLPLRKTSADEEGNFLFEQVPLGRYRLLVRQAGYRDAIVSDVVVTAGKEALVVAELEEWASDKSNRTDMLQGDSSLTGYDPKRQKKLRFLQAQNTKDRPYNQMAGICARPFTIEEVTRFAGARFDPARLVTNYAGASGYDDSRNDIVIRGNSPSYVLWQIEDLPVENPNHITSLGTTGGITPVLNIYAMGKADFLTGPFAAQYGNVVGGVFDIKLRSGNAQRFETLLQIGTQRAEMLLEGPLGRKLKGASFLFSARASIGTYFMNRIIPGRNLADPEHQDFNLKFSTGKQKWGQFDLFGIGGRSFLYIPAGKSSFYEDLRYDIYIGESYKHLNYMALGGMKYTYFFSPKTYWRTVMGMAYHLHQARWDLHTPQGAGEPEALATTYSIDAARRNYLMHSYIHSKISKGIHFKAGVLGNVYDLFLKQIFQLADWVDMDFIRKFALVQGYVQAQFRPTESLSIDLGVNAHYLSFNNKYAVSPRFALRWQPAPEHSIGIGYGWAEQMQPLQVQFFTPVSGIDAQGNYIYNYGHYNLDFIRSQQVAIDYNWNLHSDWRIQVQAYAQFMDRHGVTRDSSAASPLNAGASFYDGFLFYDQILTSRGKSRNMGIELTVEKFFAKGYYGLLSATIYDARYRASDGFWYNSIFNNRYIVNLLAGKEFVLGKARRKTLFVDLRFSTMGGKPYTPIDIEASYQSQLSGSGYLEILDESQNNALRLPAFYQVDFKMGLRINGKKGKSAHTFKIDLFNVFDIKNAYSVRYSQRFDPQGTPERGTQELIYQRGFIPDISYSVQF